MSGSRWFRPEPRKPVVPRKPPERSPDGGFYLPPEVGEALNKLFDEAEWAADDVELKLAT